MKIAVIAIIIAVSLCWPASARILPYFSYEELMAMSDLVVLMEHESTRETGTTDAQGGSGRITTAKVLAVLKGKIEGKNLTIEHFDYGATPSAPNHIFFPQPNAEDCLMQAAKYTLFVRPTRHYLAFLKLQKNGTYSAVTPQFDSQLSFLPVGGQLNDLWTVRERYGVSETKAAPLRTRKFVEVPPQ